MRSEKVRSKRLPCQSEGCNSIRAQLPRLRAARVVRLLVTGLALSILASIVRARTSEGGVHLEGSRDSVKGIVVIETREKKRRGEVTRLNDEMRPNNRAYITYTATKKSVSFALIA
ncbi:hypothetical protein EVAR_4427_1 [Eumeta japonica]|uniref:Uncharacterized protein n=1 Tax=Eumeta variegata TaxID=151549 RepID=A0A4C1SYJ1_EUMVA|nr:hypothetical protein EVAR_4427_1 [Eumeta japonica]